jgi:DNA mismatch repair protein MutL
MYEKVKEVFHTSDGKKDAQLMLLPDVITLSKKEWGIYKDNKELLIKSGFMVEDFGEDTVKLNGVPTILLELETKELFVDILREINKVARTSKQEIEEKFIATIASKASEKSNPVTKKEDVEKLLNQLLILKNPFVYTDGKTLAMKMTKYDIEKKFSRIQ